MTFKHCSCSGKNLDRFLRFAVMTILAGENKPFYGYVLVRALGEMRLFKDLPPDAGGLYRLLKSLEKERLVKSVWETPGSGPSRHQYRLTPKGKNCLKKWIETVREYQEAIRDLLGKVEKIFKKAPRP